MGTTKKEGDGDGQGEKKEIVPEKERKRRKRKKRKSWRRIAQKLPQNQRGIIKIYEFTNLPLRTNIGYYNSSIKIF